MDQRHACPKSYESDNSSETLVPSQIRKEAMIGKESLVYARTIYELRSGVDSFAESAFQNYGLT